MDHLGLLNEGGRLTAHKSVSLRYVPYVPIGVGLAFITTTVTLFWTKRNDRITSPDFWWPSISRTGAEYPEIIFFNIGLHTIALVTLFLGWCVHAIYESRLRLAGSRTTRALNAAMMVMITVFYVTCTATGSISLSYSRTQHGLMAGTMFLAGCLYICMNAWLIHAAKATLVRNDTDRFWYRYKLCVSSFTLTLCVIYVLILGAIQKKAVPTCFGENHYCTVRNVRNVLEYILVGALNIFFVSFHHDLKGFKLSLTSNGQIE